MRRLPLYLLTIMFLVSCEQDNYDKGEGEYSLMRADFVEAHVGSDLRVDYIVTDDGDSLATEPHFTVKAIQKGDTVYRAALYYNKVKNSQGQTVAEAKGMSIVPTLVPAMPDKFEEILTDPVKFESMWMATNGRYLNASIIVMTGQPDEEDNRQTIALVQDDVLTHADGKQTACYRLYHDQGGVPEYYSMQTYFSIPTNSLNADSLRLTINTYNGEIVKCVAIKK